MTRILVTGASGLLGVNFGLQFCQQHEITGLVNAHPLTGAPFSTLPVDLTDSGALQNVFDRLQPEVGEGLQARELADGCVMWG